MMLSKVSPPALKGLGVRSVFRGFAGPAVSRTVIVRCSSEVAKPEQPKERLWVGNLPWKTRVQELKELFAAYDAGDVYILKKDGRSRGMAFVEVDAARAQQAMSDLNDKEFNGRPLRVAPSNVPATEPLKRRQKRQSSPATADAAPPSELTPAETATSPDAPVPAEVAATPAPAAEAAPAVVPAPAATPAPAAEPAPAGVSA